VEKALKAVLFSRRIEFERVHDLVKLAQLLSEQDIVLPASEDELRRLNPFAVALRYDDVEIEIDVVCDAAPLIARVRRWAGEQVDTAAARERTHGADDD
jgi:HEPN domain-containing protein